MNLRKTTIIIKKSNMMTAATALLRMQQNVRLSVSNSLEGETRTRCVDVCVCVCESWSTAEGLLNKSMP